MLYSILEVRQFAIGLDHPEGVAVGRDGTVYAGGEAGQVYQISPTANTVETIANTGGFCLGITLGGKKKTSMFAIAAKRAVYKISSNRQVTVFTDSCGGRGFTNPNFSVFDSRGNSYFSDSGDWKKANGVVFRAEPDGKTSLFAEGPFSFCQWSGDGCGGAISVCRGEQPRSRSAH